MSSRAIVPNPAAPDQADVPLHQSAFVKNLTFVGLMFAYKFILDVSYLQVAESFEYQNLFNVLTTTQSQITGWILFLLLLPVAKRVFENPTPSGNILSLLILFSVMPCIVLVSFRSDYPLEYIALVAGFWVLTIGLWLVSKPVVIESGAALASQWFYMIVAVVLSATVVIYSYLNTGLRLHFDLIDVYDIRAEAREFTAPTGISYIIALADNMLPVLAVIFLVQKRWIWVGGLLLVIFVNFSITGTKQILFVPFLGILGFYAVRELRKTYRLIFGAILLCTLAAIEWIAYGAINLHGIFGYRVLFIPAELHHSYFSYFQQAEPLYFSQSLLKIYSVVDQENIQFLIGEYAIGDFTARANNGLFSDAYMNLGVIGVAVYPFIIVGFLRLLDGSMYGLPQRMLFVVSVYVAFVLLGMTLTSAFLTSGLAFLVILMYSLPRERINAVGSLR